MTKLIFISVHLLICAFFIGKIIVQQRKLTELNKLLYDEQRWHKMAYVDILTGLKNRMAYVETISNMNKIATKKDCIYAIMIDLNNFKKVNDNFGHHRGDQLLKTVAKILEKSFDGQDYMIYRIGGDEFAVISINNPFTILSKKISQLQSYVLNEEVHCSFSIGYSLVTFNTNNPIETAFINADKMMYEHKSKIKENVKMLQNTKRQ